MPGGWARDGWWPASIGRKKLLREGIAATALVKAYEQMPGPESGNEADMTLEVRVPGREPYELQGLFKRNGAAEAVHRAGRRVYEPGSVLPVRVHPKNPKRVAIDWDACAA
jgi:hypothetical protein